jgi:hypothetical protein
MAAIQHSKEEEKGPATTLELDRSDTSASGMGTGIVTDMPLGAQSLHRSLRGKEVQLFAIGGMYCPLCRARLPRCPWLDMHAADMT